MTNTAEIATILTFDPTYYLQEYVDLLDSYGESGQEAAKQHWLNCGIDEGRRGSLFFDPKYYLNQYQDVAQAVGPANYGGAISHWLEIGLNEGRRGSEEFDPVYYILANQDVANAYGNENYEEATKHFLRFGQSEGRLGRGEAAISRQHLALLAEDPASIKKLILFLVPGQEFFSGGILSIFSLYRLSRSMEAIHGARVLMCYFPGEAGADFKYRKFRNEVVIYPYETILDACCNTSEILFHVPCYAFSQLIPRLGKHFFDELQQRCAVRVNVLNQGTMLDGSLVQCLKEVVANTTLTTAHPSYCTQEQRLGWGAPLHLLPAWFYPDDAPARPFETKRDLLIVSPDESPWRETVLETIAAAMPQLEIQVIQDMPFDKYISLEKEAKWSLTFGEGMDAYFIGIFLRGGIGFSVYNDFFFTDDQQGFQTVYPSYDVLQKRIVDDIKSLNSKEKMESYNSKVRPVLDRTWGPEKTRKALASFYRGDLTLP
ncbi:MAG: hypothetical protein RLZZ609_985 [Cyanobacteriota bacterium]|jgi:hypothetical protein